MSDPITVEMAHADGRHITDGWFANVCDDCAPCARCYVHHASNGRCIKCGRQRVKR